MTADPTVDFFAALKSRGQEPLLRKASGTLRFDIADGKRTERWLVELKKGDIAVSRRNARRTASSPPTERCSTASRAARRTRWRRCCAAR